MVEISRLNNGLTIVTEEMPKAASVTIGVYVGVGSRDEAEECAGVSHFMEHLAFKGTKDLGAKKLAVLVDSFGGEMNAYTTKEITSFQVRLLGEACDLGAGILGAILNEPLLNATDIDSERSVILEELAMANDEPADLVHEQLNAALYSGHPLGREVLGSKESILAMDRDKICDFFVNSYGPNNMVVSAAGGVKHDHFVEMFSNSLGEKTPTDSPIRIEPKQRFGRPVVSQRDIEQVHVSLAYPGIRQGDPRRWSMALFDQIFGGGLSSRLFQLVREDAGLCYSIYSDRVAYRDTGFVGVYFATTPSQLGRALELVNSVTRGLTTQRVNAEELSVAKRYLRAQLLLSREDTSQVMSQLGTLLISGQQIMSIDEVLDEIEKVTPEDIIELAMQVLGSEKQISVVGPISDSDLV